MDFKIFYEQIKKKNAAQLYKSVAREIEIKKDFLYLVHGDNSKIRKFHEKANQIATPLTCAYGILELTKNLHLTVEQHMQKDSEICKLALDSAILGIEQIKIKNFYM